MDTSLEAAKALTGSNCPAGCLMVEGLSVAVIRFLALAIEREGSARRGNSVAPALVRARGHRRRPPAVFPPAQGWRRCGARLAYVDISSAYLQFYAPLTLDM